MAELTYYDYINAFYDLLQVNPLSSNAQLLYHTLLMVFNRAHWEDEIQRTNYNICNLCGLGEKAMTNARNELKQANLIDFKADKRRGQATKYSLCTAFLTVQTQNKRSTKEVQTQNKGRTYKDKRVNIEEKDITPLYSPKGEKAKAKKFDPEQMILDFTDNQELQEALRDFVSMRKSIKKSLTTERAFKGVLSKLSGLSATTAEQIELVNAAVERNWLTVYPISDKQTEKGFGVYQDNIDYAALEQLMHEKY